MKILFTCGGTAGHINPAVALARLFQERSGAEVLFVGAKGGMEERLVPKEGFALETVTISSFWRSVSPASIKHNLTTVRNLSVSRKEANRILDDFQPDLVVGTGGYASYPVVHEAAKRGIPTAVHDSNAVPGLTTKRLAKVADRVMVGYEASRAHYQHPERVLVTGTPVRGDFFKLDRQQARAALGITDDRPLVLSYWGSLGAEGMNQHMTDYLRLAAADGAPFHHIHGAGRDFATMTKALEGENLPKDLEIREYIYDMPTVMQAADLVLCRGGASTLSELTAIGKPAVIAGAGVQRGAALQDDERAAGRCPPPGAHGQGHGRHGHPRRSRENLRDPGGAGQGRMTPLRPVDLSLCLLPRPLRRTLPTAPHRMG